jgi:hypothetical protein
LGRNHTADDAGSQEHSIFHECASAAVGFRNIGPKIALPTWSAATDAIASLELPAEEGFARK